MSPEPTFDLTPWISWRFDRAAGPGGQNVNKVNTRATLLLDLASCEAFTPEEKAAIRARLRSRLDREGRIRIVSQAGRTQVANRDAALDRLHALLTAALRAKKKRIGTKPTSGARQRRLASKRQRSATKALRRSPPTDS